MPPNDKVGIPIMNEMAAIIKYMILYTFKDSEDKLCL